MRKLPPAARLYVVSVILAGAGLLLYGLPRAPFDQPLLLIGLTVLATATATLKVTLPLTTNRSTMSVSYAVDFASLLLLGPNENMIVAAARAFAQCNLNRKERNPLYRTFFSMAALIVTVQGAGLAHDWALDASDPWTALARPLVAAATAYFLLNTGLVATAIALSQREPLAATWHRNFLWSAPSYFVGALTAAVATTIVRNTTYWWLAPLTFVPLYLTYRSYKLYMGRIEDRSEE